MESVKQLSSSCSFFFLLPSTLRQNKARYWFQISITGSKYFVWGCRLWYQFGNSPYDAISFGRIHQCCLDFYSFEGTISSHSHNFKLLSQLWVSKFRDIWRKFCAWPETIDYLLRISDIRGAPKRQLLWILLGIEGLKDKLLCNSFFLVDSFRKNDKDDKD